MFDVWSLKFFWRCLCFLRRLPEFPRDCFPTKPRGQGRDLPRLSQITSGLGCHRVLVLANDMKEHLLAGLNVFGLSLLALADALWAPLDWLPPPPPRPPPGRGGRVGPVLGAGSASR